VDLHAGDLTSSVLSTEGSSEDNELDLMVEGVDLTQVKMHIFACSHTFHITCLKSNYMRRFGITPA
jgi:hypothetical protein